MVHLVSHTGVVGTSHHRHSGPQNAPKIRQVLRTRHSVTYITHNSWCRILQHSGRAADSRRSNRCRALAGQSRCAVTRGTRPSATSKALSLVTARNESTVVLLRTMVHNGPHYLLEQTLHLGCPVGMPIMPWRVKRDWRLKFSSNPIRPS